MSAPPWWNDVRTPIAFLVAPSAVPLIVALSVPASASHNTAAAAAVGVSALVSYFSAFVFGVPTYLVPPCEEVDRLLDCTGRWFRDGSSYVVSGLGALQSELLEPLHRTTSARPRSLPVGEAEH